MLRRKNQRGAAMITFGLWMTAFMGFAALAVDLARVAFTANEVQSMADIAATSAAISLAKGRMSAQATSDAQAVVGQNRVNGSTASINASDIEFGSYNYTTGTFVPGGSPASTVRATGRKTVQNVIAGVLGTPTSDVAKVAVSGFSGLGAATPTFPIAIGDCRLQDMLNCFGVDGATCLTFRSVPNNNTADGQNTAWTGFFAGSSESIVQSYLPFVYKKATCVPNTITYPQLKVGDVIQLNNGALNSVLSAIEQCESSYDGKEFVMPIVQCGSSSAPATVTGFATFVFDSVGPKSIDVHTIFKNVNGPMGGCPTCGTGKPILLS